MPYYKGLRELVDVLEKHGKLVRISHPIVKETVARPTGKTAIPRAIGRKEKGVSL